MVDENSRKKTFIYPTSMRSSCFNLYKRFSTYTFLKFFLLLTFVLALQIIYGFLVGKKIYMNKFVILLRIHSPAVWLYFSDIHWISLVKNIIPSNSHYSTYFISLFFLYLLHPHEKGADFIFSIKGKVCSCCPHLESLLCPYFVIISNFSHKKMEMELIVCGYTFDFFCMYDSLKTFPIFFCNSWPLLNQENSSFFLGRNFFLIQG